MDNMVSELNGIKWLFLLSEIYDSCMVWRVIDAKLFFIFLIWGFKESMQFDPTRTNIYIYIYIYILGGCFHNAPAAESRRGNTAMRVLCFAVHSTTTNNYLKQQKSLLIMASMALTNLEERAHHTTNLSGCPIWLIHATPLMINQFDKRLESLRGGGGISTPISLFHLHYSWAKRGFFFIYIEFYIK